ncbi:MAG: hypothetical protein DRR16_23775 [Candidatus Parabeggiatoa sp. nov. 3]|nr:MAG: hypothetical protein DRR00_26675 [Gammaproteobacteria bacterium]RKZ61939.1 MAG: hypothetical protein DRQ99_19565 [Gammaproteobacteria bacterium]RKZ80501.1 MAG: hypothetical protein DRR16_23775 [Gammaproteobacteria bacterium]
MVGILFAGINFQAKVRAANFCLKNFYHFLATPGCHLNATFAFARANTQGQPLQPRHDVGFGRGIPPRKPLTKVALRLPPGAMISLRSATKFHVQPLRCLSFLIFF